MVLSNVGKTDVEVKRDGDVTITQHALATDQYHVAVSRQPRNPDQVCSVLRGRGSVDGRDVRDIRVSCVTTHQAIGGREASLGGNIAIEP